MNDNESSWFPFSWSNWLPWFKYNPLWLFSEAVNSSNVAYNSSTDDVNNSAISIESVDWNFASNGRTHRTDMYESMYTHKGCVLRRGESFALSIRFKATNIRRTFSMYNGDRLRLNFEFGERPNVPNRTRVIVDLQEKSEEYFGKDWHAILKGMSSNGTLNFQIWIPVNVAVGLWRLTFETWTVRQDHNKHFNNKLPLYIIFNPFNADDPVYFSAKNQLSEYLYNETGTIYGGSPRNIKGRPWVYGQMNQIVLPTACHLLDRVSRIRSTERSDPIRVVRAISAIVNSSNDNGVLVGRWDGNYAGGTKPYEWTGSLAILEEFMSKENANPNSGPVRYGQCWVFAGLVTTICRSLGIACRPVTNYFSAHDTNNSLTIDRFYDKYGNELDSSSTNNSRDSIWNFHVWNEVWLRRRDLPTQKIDYDGWQVIDATPQEPSSGLMQLGPTSIKAVKLGHVGLGYDTAFVYSEVNADVFDFVPNEKSNWGYALSHTDTKQVGKLLITKGLRPSVYQNNNYQDLTLTYKAPEGSLFERISMINAVDNNEGLYHLAARPISLNEDVFVQMIELERSNYGEEYVFGLYLHNQSRSSRKVDVVMISNSVYYTGSKAYEIRRASGVFQLKSGERETLSATVTPSEYMPKTVEYCQFVNHYFINVLETQQSWHRSDNFILEKPKLWIRTHPDMPRIQRNLAITVGFTNPLSTELTQCSFSFEIAGIIKAKKMKFRNVKVKEAVETSINVKPWHSGFVQIVISFNSKELIELFGAKEITVLD